MPQSRRRNALLLAGLAGSAMPRNGQQQGLFGGSLMQLVIQSLLQKQQNEEILRRQLAGQEAIEQRLMRQQQAGAEERRRSDAMRALMESPQLAGTGLAEAMASGDLGQFGQVLAKFRDEQLRQQQAQAPALAQQQVVGGLREQIAGAEKPEQIPTDPEIISRARAAGVPLTDPFQTPRGFQANLPSERVNRLQVEAAGARQRTLPPPLAQLEERARAQARGQARGKAEGTPEVPEDIRGIAVDIQDKVLSSDAYQDFQNSLSSAVEAQNLASQAEALLAAGQSRGVGQIDQQLATLLARSLEEGRLTEGDIQRALGDVSRATMDKISQAFNRMLNGAAVLPEERRQIVQITQQRLEDRARPILEREIDLRLAPFQNLDEQQMQRLREALDVGKFVELATGQEGGFSPEELEEEARRRGLLPPGGQ